jgi:hypothetical protein
MTPFAKVIFTILMLYPPNQYDTETLEQRTVRMGTIAVSMDDTADRALCLGRFKTKGCKVIWRGTKTELALAMITRGHFESRFAQNVHEGKCKSWQCDPIKKKGRKYFRARTVWQLHREGKSQDEWDGMIGTDMIATNMAAWAATRKVSLTYAGCRPGKGVAAWRSMDINRGKVRIHHYNMLKRRWGKKLDKAAGE